MALLIGDLTVEQRITILDRFREGKHRVLITTNVLARGLLLSFNIRQLKPIFSLVEINAFFFFSQESILNKLPWW